MKEVGRFYGVGVGPGNPELLTRKAVEVINSVDVLVVPKSKENMKSLASSAIEGIIKKDIDVVEHIFPMVKDKEILEKCWKDAVDKISRELKKGKDVAFITLGDPLFYSTYIYIMRRIRERLPFVKIETIPGITSLSACLADMNLPLGEGNEKIAILPATYGLEKLGDLVKVFDTLVLMKVSRNFDGIVKRIGKLGLKENAVFVSRCGTKDFFSSDLDSMKGRDIDYLSMIIVWRQ